MEHGAEARDRRPITVIASIGRRTAYRIQYDSCHIMTGSQPLFRHLPPALLLTRSAARPHLSSRSVVDSHSDGYTAPDMHSRVLSKPTR